MKPVLHYVQHQCGIHVGCVNWLGADHTFPWQQGCLGGIVPAASRFLVCVLHSCCLCVCGEDESARVFVAFAYWLA